jgi:hypothetical protein
VTEIILRDYKGNHTFELVDRVLSQGPSEIHLDEDFLLLKGARLARLDYAEVDAVRLTSDGVTLDLHPQGTLRFDRMDGALVRPLFLHLSRLRGRRWSRLLRFARGDRLDSLEVTVQSDRSPERLTLLDLYPSGLVVMPLGDEPFELSASELKTIELGSDYRLTCATDERSVAIFGCEPTALGRFHRSVRTARQEAEKSTTDLLVEVFPALEFAQVAQLTDCLVGGRLASKAVLESIVPWLWDRIEGTVDRVAATRESYRYLRDRAGDRLWFGLRRLEDGSENIDENGEEPSGSPPPAESPADAPGAPSDEGSPPTFLFWFAAGLGSGEKRFLAVEVAAGEKGFATYLYRTLDAPSDAESYEATARLVSRAMVALNFYRVPIYATTKEIETGQRADLRLAVRTLPYLQRLRELFVGRAVHAAPDAWRVQLERLLT